MINSMGRPDPRADSFSLYCNWVANRMLLNILPKSQILDSKLHMSARASRKKAIENDPKNNNNSIKKETKDKINIKSPSKKGKGEAKIVITKSVVASPPKENTDK